MSQIYILRKWYFEIKYLFRRLLIQLPKQMDWFTKNSDILYLTFDLKVYILRYDALFCNCQKLEVATEAGSVACVMTDLVCTHTGGHY